MSNNTVVLILALSTLAFRAAILGFCAYAVFWLGFSGWWFALALVLCAVAADFSAEKKEG
ncbi:hypothetical protein ABLE91_05580 [Aquabacter sp. CN5-332]|uniref:hypothetical protein n=1 Tax=Aquabacter sp. CN5-332 TaxID=3156608 RepID=UPI0032B5DE0C